MQECNRQNMTKLVEALESGDYRQAYQRLRNDDRYCCLGVATDLAIKEGAVNGRWATDPQGAWYYQDLDHEDQVDDDYVYLPPRVAEWLGIEYEEDIRLGRIRASTMNDEGRDFREIAERIRATYLEPRP